MTLHHGAPAPEPDERYGPTVLEVLQRFDELCGPAASTPGTRDYPQRQCLAATQVLAFDAVGLSITVTQDDRRVPLAASSAEAAAAESLQFSLGEGPCLQAAKANVPVLVPDIADQASAAWRNWPMYAEHLLSRTPFRAVFAIPLSADGLSIGAVSLYRQEPTMVDFTELADALAVTNEIFDGLIHSGTFSGDAIPTFRWLDLPAVQGRNAVWQAIGLATVEMGISPADALALLRGHSYANDRLLDDVAADVIARRLPLDQMHP